MATVLKSLMFDTMRAEELPFWRIRDRAGSTIAENDSDDNLESATAKLKKAISQVKDSVVSIKLCSVNKATIGRGGNKHTFWENQIELTEEASEVTPKGQPVNDTILKLIEENNKLQRKLDRIEDQRKYEALERKIDEIKNNDVWTKILSNPQVIQGISGFLGIHPGTPVGLAGADMGAVNVDLPAREKKIKAAVMRLIKVDSKFDDNIELLADFAEKHSQEYFDSITMIRKMI